MLDSKQCLEIYEFCQKQYSKLEKKEGHYSPKHDKTVMELAAKKFKMSEASINRAFDLAAQTVIIKDTSKAERIIRNKIITGMI